MELNERLKNNTKVAAVISKFSGLFKNGAKDIITAFNILCDIQGKSEGSQAEIDQRTEKVNIMTTHMEPGVDDVISMILVGDCPGKVNLEKFEEYYGDENRAEYYYKYTYQAHLKAEYTEGRNKGKTEAECKDYYVMIRVCDKMYKSMMKGLTKNKISDTYSINRAYETARRAHYWASRNSGEPYIVHPVEVANILAKVGMESQVIAAALLHDVVEDTELTIKEIKKDFGDRVAGYVDAVTALDNQCNFTRINDGDHTYEKREVDRKNCEKLEMAVVKKPEVVFALCIKAADRIHNLRTMDEMPNGKRLAKNDETEINYLPLFKKYKLNYFVNIIEDLTWRNSDIKRYREIESKYETMVVKNENCLIEMKNILVDNLGDAFNRGCSAYGVTKFDLDFVSEVKYRPYEIYKLIEKSLGPEKASVRNVNKQNIPICDFVIVISPENEHGTLDSFVSVFMKTFMASALATNRTITDFALEGDNNSDSAKCFVLTVEDGYCNTFRCRFYLHDDYIKSKFGSNSGVFYSENPLPEEDNAAEHIYVHLRDGQIIELPKGATALDVAFMIHPEVGLSAKSATINGNSASISNILQDGDKVVIAADTQREDGITTQITFHAKIKWLSYVVTKKAKQQLIKYLSNKYEPEVVNIAKDVSLNTASNNILT